MARLLPGGKAVCGAPRLFRSRDFRVVPLSPGGSPPDSCRVGGRTIGGGGPKPRPLPITGGGWEKDPPICLSPAMMESSSLSEYGLLRSLFLMFPPRGEETD
jgi:hypothetical protein